MVVDVCTYNGERDLWEIRYNSLKDYVDEFIVIQFDKTFSGERRNLELPITKYPKTSWYFFDESVYGKYKELAESSPQTQGAAHWKREFMQKESIKDTLEHLKDEDIVFVGDMDEIWSPKALKLAYAPLKLKLRVYTYFLNNRSSEEFWGTLATPYRHIKDSCLNHLRQNAHKSHQYLGHHFTSMGGAVSLAKKLTDSYTQDSYATPAVLQNLAYNIENGRDFLGRAFTFKEDESEWPEYLKNNRDKYAHLCT